MSDPVSVARWEPQRAGIINVWRYYDEVFQFRRGRLLLRGRNGSGKSKSLELLLPYLLDANLKPNRLSTFGDSNRSMHWNLMGQGVDTATRVGYVWLEFSRPSPDALAAPEWFTLGVRLAATRTTTRVQADYFTTTLRIGDDLHLLNEARQPATRIQLQEMLSASGTVHESASQYRTAVRRTLYPGMDAERYDSLIQALLQLRRPKLSERLDPAVLSTLLSNSLPPIDSEEIAALAEGFERLDKQREHLATLEREVGAAQAVADRARTHARRILRAAADRLTHTSSTAETLARRARESQGAHEQALARRDQVIAEQQQCRLTVERARAEQAALEDSAEYRAGRELDDVRTAARDRDAALRAARERAERAHTAALAATRAADAQRELVGETAGRIHRALPGLRAAAGVAGMGPVWERCEATLAPPGTGAGLGALVRPAVRARLGEVAEIEVLVTTHDRTVSRRTDAEADQDRAQQRVGAARETEDRAEALLDRTLGDLRSDLREWAGSAALPGLDPDELVELATDDTRDPERPLAARVEAAAAPVRRDLHERRRRALNAVEDLRGQWQVAADELEQVSARAEIVPQAPRFRTSARAGGGAPLWRLVRFRSGVGEAMQASIESALESAGLLDAWVRSPESTQDEPGHDSYLDPAALLPVAGPSLAEILEPEDDHDAPADAVPAETVAAILAGIAWQPALSPARGAASVAVDDVAGRWALGGLSGTWEKAQSQHIGATARRRARERRLAELRDILADLESRIAAAQVDVRAADEELDALAATLAALPDLAPLRSALAALRAAQAQLADRLGELSAAGQTLRGRQSEVVAAAARLAEEAASHRLPESREALVGVRARIEDFRELAEDLLAAIDLHAERVRYLENAQAQAASATEVHEAQAHAVAHAQREAAAATARLEALTAAVGATYEQILARMAAARAELDRASTRSEQLQDELVAAAATLGQLSADMDRDEAARESARADRDRAGEALRGLVSATFGADAGAPGPWRAAVAERATLDVARAINAEWAAVVHEPRHITEAANRLSEVVHTHREVLAARAILGMAAAEDHQVLEVTMNGAGVGAADLLAAVTRERDEASTALTSQERDLFDRTLTGDTRRHLADRLRRARELVDTMNARLAGIRTASGIAVRITWQVDPDAPAQTRAARDLFLKDSAMLSAQESEALHTFLRARIDQARAANTAASWEQQLAEVFDYTAWHRFLVDIQRGVGSPWTTLTPRLHGVLSGGEKAIALHLPLFAAVAAHYQSVPSAPRFILLDEVFVGVDETNRGQVFRLLADLDLDLVLTSDHEWCTYAELDGIAIYQLISQGEDDPVTTAHFIWNGHQKRSADPVTAGVLDLA